jgi:ABC-type transport system involved in cytochrome c biogenesis permease subunit
MALYIAGFVLTLLCLSGLPKVRVARLLAVGAVGAGVLLHFITIASRIYILQRPPVGTLYESLLFVSLIAVLFGLFLEFRMRNNLGLLVATVAGSMLLFASQSFSGDDTMSMLIAVLNTNFWLATHVLCITTGYGFGLVAGIIAHVYLIMGCLRRDPDRTLQVLRGGYGTALIALLFTSLGTILGGIWADQSWGRFWGWDPKENGALLICLWLIWLLHSRISGHFHERGFAVGLALLNVVIALSWLGVNLLSTGLHSYGFTDKAAWVLAAFCAAEFLFAGVTWCVLWRRERG